MPRNATGQGLAQRHRGDGLTRTPIRSSKVRSSVITSEATQIRLRLPPRDLVEHPDFGQTVDGLIGARSGHAGK